MKKMILLLILPLTALMAIDFTMTTEGLFTNTTTQSPTSGTVSEVNNPYLEPVNLPKCDANNPEVQFIRSNADWSTINSSKRIFCVSPGNYKSLGNIKLTANGTAEKRRYIILNNGNDTHPGKLTDSELANYKLRFNASYWTVDRCAIIDDGGYVVTIDSGASSNILNRMYTRDVGSSVSIRHNANNNTIQNSRFEDQRDPGYDGSVCIQIAPSGVKYAQVHNTKVINNEFYNQNDGFQIYRSPVSGHTTPYQDINAEGTIIDSNIFYKDIPYMENALDIKAGSDNASNPVIISNNVMWGYTRHPDYISGSYGPGRNALMAHYSPKNIHIFDNIFFENAIAINSGSNGPASGFDKGFIDSKIYNNIIYNCGLQNETTMKVSSHVNTDFYDNYIISTTESSVALVYTYSPLSGSSFSGTIVVDPNNNDKDTWFTHHADRPWSAAYKISLYTANKIDRTTFTDFIFTYDKFTSSPKKMTLPNILDPNGSIVSPN